MAHEFWDSDSSSVTQINVSTKNSPQLKEDGILQIKIDDLRYLHQIEVEDSDHNVVGVFALKYVVPKEERIM